jgi:hypothetical protein
VISSNNPERREDFVVVKASSGGKSHASMSWLSTEAI